MTLLQPEKGDVVENYQHVYLLRDCKKVAVLDRRMNGDCIYLGEDGCTIHDRAPAVCREFDCRRLWRESDRNGRRERKTLKPLFDRGRELVEQEPIDQALAKASFSNLTSAKIMKDMQ
jgi:Fe-S-cluster containining protein